MNNYSLVFLMLFLWSACSNPQKQSTPTENAYKYDVKFSFQSVSGIGKEEGITRRDPSDIIQVNDTFHIWYTRTDKTYSGYDASIWHAWSTDSRQWTECEEAIPRGDTGSWDEHSVFTPNILIWENSYYLYYTAVKEPFVNQRDQGVGDKTAIGVARSESVFGPWEKSGNNPILLPDENHSSFDSHRVDDACLIVRNNKVWMYYKGRQWAKTPAETKMGLAVADEPDGPFKKSEYNPLINSGHEVMVWPYREGVMSLVSNTGPEAKTLQYAPNGIDFTVCGHFEKYPFAAASFRNDRFIENDNASGISWGISMVHENWPYLTKYHIQLGKAYAWLNAEKMPKWGKAFDHTLSAYDRLPAKAEKKVRKPLWNLSRNAAGLSLHFETNSRYISARWVLRNDSHMNHMADTGTKGIDLYGRDENGQWRYMKAGRPGGISNEYELAPKLDGESREYIIHLPLYDGVDSLFIGVEPEAGFKAIEPTKKPIVFYGTSICQGACASRPGMAYTNIIARALEHEVVNLGFSGNGRMETEVADLLAEIDASVYVIDCLPNMYEIETIEERSIQFVKYLRDLKPNTAILLVETASRGDAWHNAKMKQTMIDQNRELEKAYRVLKKSGMKNLYYQKGDLLTGTDGEGTVDGVHYTDLGFKRYANVITKKLKTIL